MVLRTKRSKFAVTSIVLAVLVFIAIPAFFLFGLHGARSGDRVLLKAGESLTRGPYVAFVQPWGGQGNAVGRWWGSWSDSMFIDMQRFPGNTRINWRWPPFSPRGAAGVWGYNHISYGNYDGGEAERPIAPVRVRDLKSFRTEQRWSADKTMGEGTLLTEFYLRSNPQDMESKLIEIGWFLHAPEKTRAFMAQSPQIGTYIDEHGKAWRVAMDETFCMFALADGSDATSIAIDMRRALQWLQTKKLVHGDEWLTGVAIGSEPLNGAGSYEIEHWSVALN